MDPAVSSVNGSGGHARPGLSSAALFALLWGALTELLGTAAGAALVRRAALRAAGRCPELAEISIVRGDLAYRYTLPAAWSRSNENNDAALRELVAELLSLVAALTGPLVARRLGQIPQLCERGILPRQEDGL